MFIKRGQINDLSNILNISYFLISIFFLFSAILINEYEAKFAFLLFIIITNLLIFNGRYNKNYFSILYTFYSLFFLLIPLGYILLNENYVFGRGLIEQPFLQENIREKLGISIIQLMLYWISIWISIYIVSPPKKIFKKNKFFANIKNYEVLILVSIIGILISILVHSNKVPGVNIFRFLFSDPVIIIYSSILFFYLKNTSDILSKFLDFKFLLILFLYLLNFSYLSSKGGVYILIVLIFVSITSYNNFLNFKIILPTKKLIFIIILIAFFLFVLLSTYRSYISTSDEFNFFVLKELLKDPNFYSSFIGKCERILIRVSNHGVDQFLLINQSFFEYNLSYSLDFAHYLLKNFINIILPGTIFIENYLPSSQLFGDVIHQRELLGKSNEESFLQNINTQPYTSFGLSLILFGKYFSYVIVTLYFILIQKLSLIFQNILFKATMGLVFWHSLIVYSFEVIIATDIQFFFQLYFIHLLVKSLNYLFLIYYKKS